MKYIFVLIAIFQLLDSSFALTIPTDSLYLSQTPSIHKIYTFNLSVSKGFFAAERISISKDCKYIYFHELNGYSDTTKGRVGYYNYKNNQWEGPITIFEGFATPALSLTGDTIYLQNGKYETYYSLKKIIFGVNQKEFWRI